MTLTATYRPQVWFEGETMTPTPNDGVAVRTIANASASGGNTISFRTSPSYATKQYTTGAAVDQITLRMSGDQCCQGPPTAIVSIDSFPARSIDVAATTLTDYTLPLDASNGGAAGTHTVKVEFDNNLNNGTCDRNIYLDKVTFRQVPSPPPTVSAYVKPQGATPTSASLVPAFNRCRAPNRSHGAPLSYQSCAPPSQASGNLTVGTPDANGGIANMVGSIRLTTCLSPGCATTDVRIRADVTDVRCRPGEVACGASNAASGQDYTGELQTFTRLRITEPRTGRAWSTRRRRSTHRSGSRSRAPRPSRTPRPARAVRSTRPRTPSSRARSREAGARSGSSARSRSTTGARTETPRPTATACS